MDVYVHAERCARPDASKCKCRVWGTDGIIHQNNCKLKPRNSVAKTLAEVFAPDPFPLATILREAVAHARTSDPERFPSDAAVARAAWPDAKPGSARVKLAKAMRDDHQTQPDVARAVLAVCGWAVTAGPLR